MQPKWTRCKLSFSASTANDRNRKRRSEKGGFLSPHSLCLSSHVRIVSYHIKEILESGELNKYSVVQKTWITATDGKRLTSITST